MNTRVTKRKNNLNEVKAEPPKKALKKNEILAEFTALQKRFEDLQNENQVLLVNQKSNLEAINLLEETISVLENKINVSKAENSNSISTSVQTDQIRCEECEYPAEDIYDLVDHMRGNHSLDDSEDFEHSFKCEYCDKGFHERKDLMLHIQNDHSSQVKQCKHFLEGRCVFGDACWFRHDKSKELENIKCMYCDCSFPTKAVLMSHRKKEHAIRVKKCKNDENGQCQHGSIHCWYNHTKLNEKDDHENLHVNNNDENSKLMEKVMEMVEKYSERIRKLEDMIAK